MLDNNLSPHLAQGMRAFEEEVTHLQEHFRPDAKDAEWLQEIGRRQWFLVTRDERIGMNPAELAALHRFGVGAFFLSGKDRSRCDLISTAGP